MLINGTEYVTEKEIAKHFNISLSYIRRLRYQDNGIPYYKLKGSIYFNKDELATWFKKELRYM